MQGGGPSKLSVLSSFLCILGKGQSGGRQTGETATVWGRRRRALHNGTVVTGAVGEGTAVQHVLLALLRGREPAPRRSAKCRGKPQRGLVLGVQAPEILGP